MALDWGPPDLGNKNIKMRYKDWKVEFNQSIKDVEEKFKHMYKLLEKFPELEGFGDKDEAEAIALYKIRKLKEAIERGFE